MAEYFSTEDFLAQNGVKAESIRLIEDPNVALTVPGATAVTTEEYLNKQNVKEYDFAASEERKNTALKHRIDSRTKVLAALIIPMYVVPIWLMVMLSLPAFKVKAFSERMQYLLLGALASDLVGLCYVVTRDLFPQRPDDDDE